MRSIPSWSSRKPADDLVTAQPKPSSLRLLGLLAIVLALVVIISTGVGAVAISPFEVLAILADHAGFTTGHAFTGQQDLVLWNIRLPRVLMAVLAGSALAMTGAVLQNTLRNPLADPSLVGLSGGASVGITIVSGYQLEWLDSATACVAAIVSVFVAGLLGYLVVRPRGGQPNLSILVIAGIAVMLVTSAIATILTFVTPSQGLELRQAIAFGNLGGATWAELKVVAVCVGLGTMVILAMSQVADLFVLGEVQVRQLGVNVPGVRLVLLVGVSFLTGAAVVGAGNVGFVGLVIPHAVHRLVGHRQIAMLPACALAGAAFLVATDICARTLISPAEIPIGVMTSVTGGPLLLLMLAWHARGKGWMR